MLIDRSEPGRPPYSVFPGGRIDEGESAEDTAVREVHEELGVTVAVDRLAPLVVHYPDHCETYFRARLPDTDARLTAGDDARRTVVISPDGLLSRSLLPASAAEVVACSWATGDWWHGRVDVEEPSAVAPWRVRAGALIIDGDRIALINCGDRVFEFPGGGVETGESIIEAVVREVREETGLAGVVSRRVANVFQAGRHEHYFLVAAGGEFATSGLDLPDGERPVWAAVAGLPGLPLWPKRLAWRVAEWHRRGWPEYPVVLCDSIQDLGPPCQW